LAPKISSTTARFGFSSKFRSVAIPT
jgi:hypothetical protein